MNLTRKKIRFMSRTDDPDNPVDRMLCFNPIRGLEEKGYDVGLYQGAEKVDLLITLSWDLACGLIFMSNAFNPRYASSWTWRKMSSNGVPN